MKDIFNTIINNLAPILSAVALVIGGIVAYLNTRTKSNNLYQDGLTNYIKLLKTQIDQNTEDIKGFREREIGYLKEISDLKTQITGLQRELLSYQTTDTKIENAKSSLHDSVETKLEDLKHSNQ